MSKKSRKRNKKILGALAAGLGAVALMKRKKAASVASSDDAGLNVTHPALTAKNWISKKSDTSPVNTDSRFDTRFSKPTEETMSKGLRSRVLQAKANAPKGIYPPGMKPMQRIGPGPRHFSMKSGGRVTGAAKRGFGRALMKGKK